MFGRTWMNKASLIADGPVSRLGTRYIGVLLQDLERQCSNRQRSEHVLCVRSLAVYDDEDVTRVRVHRRCLDCYRGQPPRPAGRVLDEYRP